MTGKKPPAKPPGFLAFKAFLTKVAKVPKSEIDEQEAAYRRETLRKKKGA